MTEDKGSWSDSELPYVVAGLDGLPRFSKDGRTSVATAIDVTTLLAETDGKPTLDYLYATAKSIGRVKVEEDWNGKSTEVSIRFHTKGGSTIWAKGDDSDVVTAFQKAIAEARVLNGTR